VKTGKKKNNSGNPNPLPPPKETQFKKGQSGNPKGKPKLTEDEKTERAIQKYLETANSNYVKRLIEKGEYEEYLDRAINATIAMGKMDGIKFMNDYNGNKPSEKVVHEGNDEKPINVKLTGEALQKELIKRGLDSIKLFDE